ncbi:MAG TPA: hypothetical protein VF026_23780 [Ktedonobacteraceae bacterium]
MQMVTFEDNTLLAGDIRVVGAREHNLKEVIEHNLAVIEQADWIIDLGPEGGKNGGEIVFTGKPEQLVRASGSLTGEYLRRYQAAWE